MNTDNITTNDVREISHPQIAKRANITTITSSLLLILAGILAVILWSGVAGVILVITGAIVFIIKPKTEIYEPTGCHIERKSYFLSSEKSEITRKILEGELNDSTEPVQFLQQGGTRLDVLISKDRDFVAWQVFHFVPHKYVPVSKVYTLTGPPAVQFARFIKRSDKG